LLFYGFLVCTLTVLVALITEMRCVVLTSSFSFAEVVQSYWGRTGQAPSSAGPNATTTAPPRRSTPTKAGPTTPNVDGGDDDTERITKRHAIGNSDSKYSKISLF